MPAAPASQRGHLLRLAAFPAWHRELAPRLARGPATLAAESPPGGCRSARHGYPARPCRSYRHGRCLGDRARPGASRSPPTRSGLAPAGHWHHAGRSPILGAARRLALDAARRSPALDAARHLAPDAARHLALDAARGSPALDAARHLALDAARRWPHRVLAALGGRAVPCALLPHPALPRPPGPVPASPHAPSHDPLRAGRACRRRELRAAGGEITEGRYQFWQRPSLKMSGGVLLSHAVSRAVPSALKGLTSGFGMGPGVSPSPWPP